MNLSSLHRWFSSAFGLGALSCLSLRHALGAKGGRLPPWVSLVYALGLVACDGPGGNCGGLELGDELVFVAGDAFVREPAGCTIADVGFYPGQEFLFQVEGFPKWPMSGNPCRAGEGPVTTVSEWEMSYIYDSGGAERLFHIVADAASRQCRGKILLELATEDLSVSESPSSGTLRVEYWPFPAPYEPGAPPGCPPACGGIIPGTVRKGSAGMSEPPRDD